MEKKNPASRGKCCVVLEVTDTVELGNRDLTAPLSSLLLVKQPDSLQPLFSITSAQLPQADSVVSFRPDDT